MRDHLIHGAIATAIAGTITTGALHYVPREVHQVTTSIAVSKHAWPDLSSDEVIALGDALAVLKDTKIVIMTNDATGADLAEDIDDAVELADRNCSCGISSVLDHAVVPFGYGVGVIGEPADKARADKLAGALVSATAGRLAPIIDLSPANKTYGNLIVAIGKHRAK
jgi:hypothetical protein